MAGETPRNVALTGAELEANAIRQNLGQVRTYTQEEIDLLDAVTWGNSPIWRDDGVRFKSNGLKFSSIDIKSNTFSNQVMQQARLSDVDVCPLTIPTYIVANDEVVHPSVRYVEQAWNGYNWWMVITPYPAADNKKENPSVLVSVNGTDWVVPPGGVNPVVPEPAGLDFNSDPQLFFSVDGVTLYMLYRFQGGGLTKFFIIKTIDGVNWSTPFETHSTTFTAERHVSPSVNWDAATSEWVIHAPEIHALPYVYETLRVSNIESAWGTFTAVPITIPADMTQIWHQEVHINPDGSYYGICVDNDNTGGQQRMLYSKDGTNFNVSAPLTLHKGYKSSIVQNQDGTYWAFIGDLKPNWHVTRCRVMFDKSIYESAMQAANAPNPLALSKLSSLYDFFDTFERADNLTTPGSADTGQAWSVVLGTVGIIGNKIYCPTSADNKVVHDLVTNNFDLSIGVSGEQNGTYILFRYSSNTNFWRLKYNVGKVLQLQKLVAGTLTTIFDIELLNTSAPSQIRIVSVDNCISIYYNNKFFAAVDDSDLSLNTQVGLQLTNNTQSVDFFSAKAI